MDTRSASHAQSSETKALPQQRRLRRWLLIALAAAVVAAGVFLFTLFRPTPVNVAQARAGTAVESVYASGVVEYVREARLAPTVSAPIRVVRVREGELVRAGHVLAELASGPEQATALQLAAQALQARDVARRNQSLFQSGYVSRATRDDTRRQAEAAEAAARAARERLRDYRITAPFAGRVIRREAEPGDLARPGEVMFVIADTADPRITADIDERDAGRVSAGLAAFVRADAFPGQRFNATVSSLTPQGDSAARVFRARLALPHDAPLRPGMTVEANIVIAQRDNAILVPADAVQDQAVWVVQDGRVRRRPVKVGVVDAEEAEIASGLAAGETIVRAPPEALKDGGRVSVRAGVKR